MPDFYKATKNQLRTIEQGADSMIYLSVADEAINLESGDFIFDRRPHMKHLFLAGTTYEDSVADELALKLKKIIQDKGYDLPE